MELEQDIKIGSVVTTDHNFMLFVVAEIASIKTVNEDYDRIELTCFPFDNPKDRYAWQRRETYEEYEDGIELSGEPTEETLQFVRDQVESMASFDEDEDTDEDEIYPHELSTSKIRRLEEYDLPSAAADYEMDIEQLEKENNSLTEQLNYSRQLVQILTWISGGLVIIFLLFAYFYLR